MRVETLWEHTRFVCGPRMVWWKDCSLLRNLQWRWWNWLHFFWNSKVAWKLTYWPHSVPNPFGSPFDIDHSKWFWKVNTYCTRRTQELRGKR